MSCGHREDAGLLQVAAVLAETGPLDDFRQLLVLARNWAAPYRLAPLLVVAYPESAAALADVATRLL